MGVKGLWQLLLPIGRRISIETLEGQVLAVDASIWLTQFIKAMRDAETGAVQPAAHLKGFFRRICRLLFHRIRPVFVFDGTMPEVKAAELAMRRRRREKFAIASQETLQRLAKKLLHENLTKQKIRISNKGECRAFESGFNQGEHNVNAASQNANDVPHPGDELSEETMDGKSPIATSSTCAVASLDLVNNEMRERESSETEQDRPINDWDEPRVTDDQLERLGLFDSDDSDSKSVASMADNNNLDMSFLARLPPNRRKDAIEKVQRQQRMRSRKEHMPAAGDPLLFSQVQLANFLKSSQLNRNIHTSLAAAVKHDNNGGDVMASDTTTRLELIHETKIQANRGSQKKRSVDDLKDKATDENSKHAPFKQKRTLKDNGDDNDDDGDVGIHLGSKRLRQTRTRMLQIEDTDDDSFSSATINRSWTEPWSEKADKRATNTDQTAISVESDSSNPDEGGFIRQVPPDNDSESLNLKTENDVWGSLKSTQADKDEALAQKFEDELLAAAIQDVEHMRAAEMSDNCTTIPLSAGRTQNLSAKVGEATEHDDESVDWEDGDRDIDVSLISNQEVVTNDDMGAKLKDAVNKDVSNTISSKFTHVADWEMHQLGKEKSGDFDHPIRKLRSSTNTSAALERAEKEASKLADWAGRVFRRAMKDAMTSESVSNEWGESLGSQAVSSTPNVLPADLEANTGSSESPSFASHSKQHELNVSNLPKTSVDAAHQEGGRKGLSFLDEPQSLDALEQAMRVVEQNDRNWAEERNKRERDLDSVSDEMKLDVMQLLHLFGIPYVEAPAEAEAQCAELESLGLVHGIITEDSDVFVFGGKTVYKNIFEDQKYAEVYKAADAEREMGLGRNEMVALAMLLGGDYTEGVKGVGIVNAMEIIDAFRFSEGVKEGLRSFKTWLDGVDIPGNEDSFGNGDLLPSIRTFQLKHQSARSRWVAPTDFPGDNILKAYLHPVVDNSTDNFTWGNPDLAGLMVFCSRNIGWRPEETKSQVERLTDGFRSGLRQTRLDAYMPMKYEDSIKFANVRSKRLQQVLKHKQTSQMHEGN